MNTERSNSTLDPTATSIDDLPLPSDIPTLQAMIRELLVVLKNEKHEREGLQQRLDLLLRKLYGPKAERFDPNQPWLLPEMAPSAWPPMPSRRRTSRTQAKSRQAMASQASVTAAGATSSPRICHASASNTR